MKVAGPSLCLSSPVRFFIRQGSGKLFHQFLHNRLVGDRIISLDDHSAQLIARLPPHWTPEELYPQAGHSVTGGDFSFLCGEVGNHQWNCGLVVLGFEIDR